MVLSGDDYFIGHFLYLVIFLFAETLKPGLWFTKDDADFRFLGGVSVWSFRNCNSRSSLPHMDEESSEVPIQSGSEVATSVPAHAHADHMPRRALLCFPW